MHVLEFYPLEKEILRYGLVKFCSFALLILIIFSKLLKIIFRKKKVVKKEVKKDVKREWKFILLFKII